MANVDAQVETLRQRLAPAVAALDLELYDVELTGAGKAAHAARHRRPTGGVDLDAITAVTQAVSPILDDAPDAHRLVPARSEQPGRRARAAHARALRRRRRRAPCPIKVRTDSGHRAACTARSSTPTTTHCTIEVDGAARGARVRRHHAGAHRVRVGSAAAPRRQERSAEASRGPPRAKG